MATEHRPNQRWPGDDDEPPGTPEGPPEGGSCGWTRHGRDQVLARDRVATKHPGRRLTGAGGVPPRFAHFFLRALTHLRWISRVSFIGMSPTGGL